MPTRRWRDLSERNRRLIVLGSVVEGLLKIAALADLRRRPAVQIRGSKWVWATVVVLVNSVGGAPLAYFLFGRRQPDRSTLSPG
ncbi:PLD nuclease N-terminal domain-containing protein [Blastococcus sp. CT_GayMR16]|uniref:PLD nuclease N-terminal domain-containing protein n=1 Tax=Blastococcus sp. CT_GayMR16 TaxID=2559607 RepID=UPI001074288B|nr:PLD nuclease N-terminal domain-containing protein [Blastococcus sp. CT_GayMR16]TFV90587.1 PLDc_N domain-containing protein [Blastococcus sp. CT_GayMR16]